MDIVHEIEECKKSLLETQKFLMEFEVDHDPSERLALGEELCRIKELQKRHDGILEQAKSMRTFEEFENSYNQNWEAVKGQRINVKNMGEFKAFKKELESISGASKDVVGGRKSLSNATTSNSQGDVVETGGDVVSLVDPWSKAIMKNPMKNTKCGHNYEYESVMAMIKTDSGVLCPVLGCGNKSHIQPKHLVANKELRMKIQAQAYSGDMSSDEE